MPTRVSVCALWFGAFRAASYSLVTNLTLSAVLAVVRAPVAGGAWRAMVRGLEPLLNLSLACAVGGALTLALLRLRVPDPEATLRLIASVTMILLLTVPVLASPAQRLTRFLGHLPHVVAIAMTVSALSRSVVDERIAASLARSGAT